MLHRPYKMMQLQFFDHLRCCENVFWELKSWLILKIHAIGSVPSNLGNSILKRWCGKWNRGSWYLDLLAIYGGNIGEVWFNVPETSSASKEVIRVIRSRIDTCSWLLWFVNSAILVINSSNLSTVTLECRPVAMILWISDQWKAPIVGISPTTLLDQD